MDDKSQQKEEAQDPSTGSQSPQAVETPPAGAPLENTNNQTAEQAPAETAPSAPAEASQQASAPSSTPEVKKSVNVHMIAVFVTLGVVLAGMFSYLYVAMGATKAPEYQQATPSSPPSSTPPVDQTSDAALEAESSALDSNLDQVNAGLSEVDQSINDQQGDLSEY